jgi:hypothetical protein
VEASEVTANVRFASTVDHRSIQFAQAD